MNVDDDDRATQRLASRNTPRQPFGPHSDTTLPNEPVLRTIGPRRPGCQDFICPCQWRAGDPWATREPVKEIRMCGRRPHRCSRPSFLSDIVREAAPIQAILML